MRVAEVVHRQKSVELENIRVIMGGELNLKLFAYPVKKQIYPGRLAFVLYYEYETLYGSNQNLDKRSGFMPRFWIGKNENIEDLAKSGKLILKSHSYQDLRSKIVQMAVFDSASEDSLNASKNNINWFKEHRDDFSKRRIGSNDFARDKKRLETIHQSKIINAEEITETEFVEVEPEAKAETKVISKNESRLVPKISELKQFIKNNRRHLKKVA